MISIGSVIYDEKIDSINHFLLGIKQAVLQVNHIRKIEIEILIVLNPANENIFDKKKRFCILDSFKKMMNDLYKIEVSLYENPINNIGLARKIIVNQSNFNWVYFTDPDVAISENIINRLEPYITKLEAENFFGLTGQVINFSNEKKISDFFNFCQKLSTVFKFGFQGCLLKPNSTVDHAPTAHLLLNRQKVIQIGNFCESFSIVGEDLDLTHRATQKGLVILFSDISVNHIQNISQKKLIQKFFNYGQAQAKVFMINGFSRKRIYRLIPAIIVFFFLISVMQFLIFFAKDNITSALLLVAITTLTLVATNTALVVATGFVYGLGAIYRFAIDLGKYRNDQSKRCRHE